MEPPNDDGIVLQQLNIGGMTLPLVAPKPPDWILQGLNEGRKLNEISRIDQTPDGGSRIVWDYEMDGRHAGQFSMRVSIGQNPNSWWCKIKTWLKKGM